MSGETMHDGEGSVSTTCDHRTLPHPRARRTNLELDVAHGCIHREDVSLVQRAVGLDEVRLEEDLQVFRQPVKSMSQSYLEEVAGETLDGVVDG